MRIVILTTKTAHHTYFIKKISNLSLETIDIFFETRKIKFPFKTFHNFELKRKNFENKNFNKKIDTKKTIANTFYDINSKECIDKIKSINPKIIIVFGTGKINKDFIKNFKNKIFNLHGGDPSLYRGLDSHLWGIYHNDFNFVVTLHKLKLKLDTGDVVYKKVIKIKKIQIWQIRYFTTLACIDLVSKLIKNFRNNIKYPLIKQIKIGRYYSSMPSNLKEICCKKMKSYNAS